MLFGDVYSLETETLFFQLYFTVALASFKSFFGLIQREKSQDQAFLENTSSSFIALS